MNTFSNIKAKRAAVVSIGIFDLQSSTYNWFQSLSSLCLSDVFQCLTKLFADSSFPKQYAAWNDHAAYSLSLVCRPTFTTLRQVLAQSRAWTIIPLIPQFNSTRPDQFWNANAPHICLVWISSVLSQVWKHLLTITPKLQPGRPWTEPRSGRKWFGSAIRSPPAYSWKISTVSNFETVSY